MKLMKKLLPCMLMLVLLIAAVPVFAQTAKAEPTYYVEVDVTNQIVTVYYNNDRTNSGVVRQMLCSSGKNDKTPRGTFTLQEKKQSTERTQWHPLNGGYWGKWCTRITGHYLFHSIPYTSKGGSQPSHMVKALGTAASSGCVRLRDADAYWIAMNCLPGTKVRIYKSLVPNPDLHELLQERSFSIDNESYEEFLGIANALEEGSTGEEVMQLQARLNLLGYAAGKADGTFGAHTTAAVKAFQAEKGLTQNGRVTSRVWNYIFADDAPYAPIVIGSSGLHVKELQSALKTLKLYSGEATGIYDNATANGVRLYQSAYGLTVNGKATTSVRKAIVKRANEVAKRFGDSDYEAVFVSTKQSMATVNVSSSLSLRQQASTSSKSLASMSNGTVLTVLEKGSTWSKVQYNNLVGYCKNSYLKFYTETSYSLGFEAVVPDPDATPTPTPDPNATPKPVASTDILETGSEGSAVVNLQRALKELCFYSGELTGVFDEATAEAVRTFQKYNGLTVDGIATTAVQVWILDTAEEIKAKFGDAAYDFAITETHITTAKVKTKSSLNLRQEASTSSKKLGSVKDGAVVTVLEKGSKWSKIQHGDKVGYLMNQYLTFGTKVIEEAGYVVVPTPDPNATPVPTPDPNATPKPAASSETLKVGSEGSAVRQLQRALAELKLYDGEITGLFDEATEKAVKTFQSASDLTADGKATTSVQTKILNKAESVKNQFAGSDYKATVTETTVTTAKIKVKSSLILRQKASTSSKKLASMKNGSIVTVLEKGSKWSKIDFNGTVGYCMSSYLTFSTSIVTDVVYEALPTVAPTATPEPTAEPTVEPTAEPTVEPTAAITPEPTVESTIEPTAEPTAEPTVEPTAEPTAEPTVEPTAEPEATVNPDAQYAIVKEEVTVLCEINGSMKIRTADIGDCFEVIEIVNNTVTVKFEGGIGFIALDSVEIADSPAEAAKISRAMTAEAEPAAAEEAAAEVSEPAEASAAPDEGAAEEAA